MRKTREEKAITLIALIITIVVLLILAVVAINAVTGDGIIQHAVNAKTEYEKAQTDEEMMLSNYETYLKGNVDTWDGTSKKTPKIKDGNWYIYTCSEFKFFADFVNKEPGIDTTGIEEITENTTVYLMSNLDLGARQKDGVLTSGTEWTPIGKDTDIGFAGIFEGNNHYIEGVYINKEGNYGGIFGRSINIIKNLKIKDGYIEVEGNFVGGIAGSGENIINCHNIGTTIKNSGNFYAIGGITGRARIIENCINSGTIIAEAMINNVARAGGVVGFLPSKNASIKNCKNTADINCQVSSLGGVIGMISTGGEIEIENCINTGNITGVDNIGGIIGVITLSDVGGIELINCYNTGDITGNGQIGGILGNLSLKTNRTVKACYNTGKVNGKNYVGRIIGYVSEPESNFWNIKGLYYLNIEGNTVKGIGNIADVTGIVEKKLEADMKTITFADTLNNTTNLDIWVGSNTDYPRLKWEK